MVLGQYGAGFVGCVVLFVLLLLVVVVVAYPHSLHCLLDRTK